MRDIQYRLVAMIFLIMSAQHSIAQTAAATNRRSAEPKTRMQESCSNVIAAIRNRFDVKPRIGDLVVNPPRVRSIGVVPLRIMRQGNALLVVEFEAAETMQRVLTISTEQGNVLLRDDGKSGDQKAGDGVYSAIVRLDLPKLKAAHQKRAGLRTISTFRNRARIQLPVNELLRVPPIARERAIPIFPPFPPVGPVPDIGRSLMITDTSVIEDPSRTFNSCTNAGTPIGKWTFGYLMQQMANTPVTGINASDFVLRWLNRWAFDQVINDWPVPKRPNISSLIIQPWQQASGANQPLDLSKAPFRLLAIVNRIDLRDNLVYGTGSAGEGRFVFGAIGPGCQPLQFTVIFEYGIRRRGCLGLRSWAQQWAALSGLTLGSPQYNAALEAITEQFAKAGADPLKPNQSALNQLRTNEIALSSPWQLREFHIAASDSDAGQLREVTVKQTPDITLNGTATLTDYVNQNSAATIAQTQIVPITFPNAASPFLGGSADVPSASLFWNNGASPTISVREARHMFSLQTCNGCHAGETQTGFTNVKPGPFGSPVQLSGFLTGIDVTDPADGAPVRHFADLQRRADDLSEVVNSPCILQIPRRPLLMTH